MIVKDAKNEEDMNMRQSRHKRQCDAACVAGAVPVKIMCSITALC